MGVCIVVANLMGGVGKTTIAVNVARVFAKVDHHKVALIDADSKRDAYDWATRAVVPLEIVRSLPLPATPATEWITGVGEVIELVDLTVIDLPPANVDRSAIAVQMADEVVVPVVPGRVPIHSRAAIHTSVETFELLNNVVKRAASHRWTLIVPSRVDPREADRFDKPSTFYRDPYAPPIGERSEIMEARERGQSVIDFAPESRAAREIRKVAWMARRIARRGAGWVSA